MRRGGPTRYLANTVKELSIAPSAHVCVCTNERGLANAACAKVGGDALFRALKARALLEGRAGTHWITRTGCLGLCNDRGTTVVVYRRGEPPRWLEVEPGDEDALWALVTRT